MLLHDLPDFLSEYANALCEEIPEKFLQVKNIVLAAFPIVLRPPDPMQVNNLDQIEEFKHKPKIVYPIYDIIMKSLNFS